MVKPQAVYLSSCTLRRGWCLHFSNLAHLEHECRRECQLEEDTNGEEDQDVGTEGILGGDSSVVEAKRVKHLVARLAVAADLAARTLKAGASASWMMSHALRRVAATRRQWQHSRERRESSVSREPLFLTPKGKVVQGALPLGESTVREETRWLLSCV